MPTDEYPLLSALESPEHLRGMDSSLLYRFADEVRAFIIDSVTRTGGHLGAGLGVVELTLALFAEFRFNDRDKLVWDVGHQCYPHKIITGRRDDFGTLRQWEGLSGFPDPRGVALRHGQDRARRYQHLDRDGLRAGVARASGGGRAQGGGGDRRRVAAGGQRLRGAQPRWHLQAT